MTAPFSSDPLLNATLGTYRILRPLGMGGMGKVYLAQDETLKRFVALKVIHEQYRDRQDYRARLMGEATAIANLSHPNIVHVYTAGEQDGILYFAMEMITGRNLKALLDENLIASGSVNIDAVIQIGTAIAAALDYAHERGVIHRDVKPGNVIITKEHHVYLTDFGLALDVRDQQDGQDAQAASEEASDDAARPTAQTAPSVYSAEAGTPQYMSPEQIDHVYPVGAASDQYALGVMMFEMLTGMLPFEGDDVEAIYQKHLNNLPPNAIALNRKLTSEIQDILLRALSKHPADRYESCAAFMRQLTRAWKTAQERQTPQQTALPALPAGTRAKHGLAPVSRDSRPEPKPRATDHTIPVPDTRVTENTRPSPAPLPASRSKFHPSTTADDRLVWLGAGAIGMVIVLLVLFLGYRVLAESNALSFFPAPTPTLTPSPVILPSATATFPSIAPPTATATLPPTLTPTLTFTPSPTEIPGDPFILLYDDNSFSLFNFSAKARTISLLKFERLDFAGEVLETFSGSQWARFNNIIRPNTCMRVKLSTANNLIAPEECRNTFDAEITISPRNNADFWTIRSDSSEFRVLWSDVEIKRCSTIARRCEIQIP